MLMQSSPRFLRHAERGFGMVEVLVSMLLLALGVLGFALMQVRAVEATGEAITRSQTMFILRSLGDAIRVNSTAQGSYPAAVTAYSAITAAPTAVSPACVAGDTCTAAQLASQDAYQAALNAWNLSIKINMLTCPGVPTTATVQRQCLIGAWGKTNPTIGSSNTAAPYDCITSAGAYNSLSTCVIMEAY